MILLKLYRQRWYIETYFKFLKYTHKFQHMDQINIKEDTYQKICYCNLILFYFMKIIHYYVKLEENMKNKLINNKTHESKINNSHTSRK